jgi:hypothetical protein
VDEEMPKKAFLTIIVILIAIIVIRDKVMPKKTKHY